MEKYSSSKERMDVDMLHIIWLKTQTQIHVQRKKAQILEIDNRKQKVKKVYCEKRGGWMLLDKKTNVS